MCDFWFKQFVYLISTRLESNKFYKAVMHDVVQAIGSV